MTDLFPRVPAQPGPAGDGFNPSQTAAMLEAAADYTEDKRASGEWSYGTAFQQLRTAVLGVAGALRTGELP